MQSQMQQIIKSLQYHYTFEVLLLKNYLWLKKIQLFYEKIILKDLLYELFPFVSFFHSGNFPLIHILYLPSIHIAQCVLSLVSDLMFLNTYIHFIGVTYFQLTKT